MQRTFTIMNDHPAGRVIDFKGELNAEQFAVVEGGDGPCVVIAGAGSGKTRTIVYRVAYLLSKGVRPEEILLLTFTNKAANEMMTRIEALAAGGRGVWGGTFHSISNRILRGAADRIGFTPSFTILDEEDAKDLLKAVMRELGLTGDAKKFPSPTYVKEILSYALNAIVPLEKAILKKNPKLLPLIPDFERITVAYETKKKNANAMDFDDLLAKLHHLLATDVTFREAVSSRFRYVLVDEYQDTNPLQAAVVKLLAGPENNVLVVGDDAQSIYSFRAADVRNILDFPRHFPGAKLFKLETNYRSTPDILDLANDVIGRNVDQYPKNLKAVITREAKPVVVPTASASQEAAFVVSRIHALLEDGTKPEHIAVLFRATFHSQALEFELMKHGIDYDYRGGMKFFERAHVKDALAFVRIAANFVDESAWLRVLGIQTGIGDVMAGKIYGMMRSAGSLAYALLAPVEQMCGARAAPGWRDLRQVLQKMHDAGNKPADIVRAVIKSSYADYLENEYPNWRERMEDVEQLATFAENYENAAELLVDVTLDDAAVQRAQQRGRRRDLADKLVLSTIHQAKGLEWEAVFVIHMVNSGFPNRKAAIEEGGMEEERRLFYVAVTRAKRHLYLSYPATMGRDAFSMEQPSSFLEECDPKCLDLGLVEERSSFGGGGIARSGKTNWGQKSVVDADGFYEDDAVVLDADDDVPQDPFAGMKGRMKKVNEDWRKKSFLGDV